MNRHVRRLITTVAVAAALVAPATTAHADGSTERQAWIASAENLGDYSPGFLENAWRDPNMRAMVPVSITATVTHGRSVATTTQTLTALAAGCGTRWTSWVSVNRQFKNYFGQVLFNFKMQKNYSYDGCRTWHESTIVTPGTSTLGSISGWSYDRVTASADGYEYANGNSYGRTYSERTGRWTALGQSVSLWTRCHANWDGTTGCAYGEA